MLTNRRILLHPGLHKSGTSSIQHFLWRNRDRIKKHAHLFLLRHLKPITDITHRYSRTGNPLDLIDLTDQLDEVFEDVPEDERDILVSCEGLSGHLPGWPGVADYRAAGVTISYITAYLAERFATQNVRIVLTTRNRVAWLFSAYRHHLKGHRMRMDHMEFMDTFGDAADFRPLVETLRKETGAEVFTLPLELSLTNPKGPGGALLDAFGWHGSLRHYKEVGHGNSGPTEELWNAFLRLNRSKKSDKEIAAAKEKLAIGVDLGHWRDE